MPRNPPKDLTIYRPFKEVGKWGIEAPQAPASSERIDLGQDKSHRDQPVWSFSGDLHFCWAATDGTSPYPIYRARALVCLCGSQSEFSATLRVDDPEGPVGQIVDGEMPGREHPRYIGAIREEELQAEDGKSGFLFSFDEVAAVVYQAIFCSVDQDSNPGDTPVFRTGLIVLSGQTGTGKTQILTRLLRQYLKSMDDSAWAKNRRRHLVTLEDPIENLAEKSSILDYTPRHIGLDVTDLKEGFFQALRQTPAALVVGEIRTTDDWKQVLDFAATGHLCVATTHAGSLVETMRKIIEATGANTPDRRSSLAEKLIAVVNLRQLKVDSPRKKDKYESMLTPAIWRNAHGGANFFISDGLSAVLPRRRTTSGKPVASCRGRADFVESITDQQTFKKRYAACLTKATKIARKAALVADIEGI